jgi:hypothetical protein
MIVLQASALFLANAAAFAGAGALLRRFSPKEEETELVLFLLFRLLIISATVLIAGVTHTLTTLWISGASVLLLLGLGCRGFRGFVQLPRCPGTGRFMAAFGALLGIRLALQVWYFAPHVGDALSYHLPKIAEWVRAGGFTAEMGLDNHATFPAGFELIETWWVLFLRHDVLIELAGLEALALGFAAVRSIGRQLGLSEHASSFAGLLYSTTPGVHIQATSCLNDGAVAALILAAVSLILSRAPVGLTLTAVGLGVGVKPSFAYAVPGLALLLFWYRPTTTRPEAGRVAGVAAGIVGIGVGLYWYVRNALWFGNPIHPVTLGGLAGSSGDRWIQLGPNGHSLFSNVDALIGERIFDTGSAYGAYLDGISGWGPVVFSAGVIALLEVCRTDMGFRKLGAAFLVSLFSVLALVAHDRFYMRFVLFFPAALCVAVSRLSEENRTIKLFVWIGIFFSVFATTLPNSLPRKDFLALADAPWRLRSIACSPDMNSLNAGGDVIAYMADVRGFAYPLYRPDYSRRVVYVRARSARELLECMRVEHAALLYVGSLSDAQRLLLDECVKLGELRQPRPDLYELVR